MKFTLSWLHKHLKTDETVTTLAKAMTDLGLEVESIEDKSKELESFTIAKVVDTKPHPNADRLRLCIVDTGERQIQVVCGAPNAKTGLKGVFAPPGAIIPSTGTKLKPSKIRGVESNGMLCSENELGLSENHEGIIELPAQAPVGGSFSKYMNLSDPLFDISITPNRADCLGIMGIARDLAAAGVGTLVEPNIPSIKGEYKCPLDIRLEFTVDNKKNCPLFVGRYIRGVKNQTSPKWLQDRLLSIGLRPISALVDMTNYLTIDMNRPVHVFDADKISGDYLSIRSGCNGENFKALNGKEYVLNDTMTAICDQTGVLSLAGVMGGENTGCTNNTENVFVEIALFDATQTARTGRELNLESDARYRFERGVDPAFVVPGMEIATQLVLDMCGGNPSEMVIAGTLPTKYPEITFQHDRIRSLGGVNIEKYLCIDILQKLGFKVASLESGSLSVSPPSWRADIVGEADIVEEILRVHGFENIPAISLKPLKRSANAALPLALRRLRWAQRALASKGMCETVTWSFMSSGKAKLFGGGLPELTLANPISSDLDVMRPSIIPNLISAGRRNADRGFSNLALFETGPQYAGHDKQSSVIAGIRSGNAIEKNHYGSARDVDCFDAKGDALVALSAAEAPIANLTIKQGAPDWYHPGRSGKLTLGKTTLAQFGELHPIILKKMDIDFPLVAFEVFIELIPTKKQKRHFTKPALKTSDFPAVERDFAFIVNKDVVAEDVLDAARSADRTIISKVSLFDLYEDTEVGKQNKSLAITVKLEPTSATLTDSDIEKIAQKVINNVKRITGGELRR